MSETIEFPSHHKDALRAISGAYEEAKESKAEWAIVLLPADQGVEVLTSHEFSFARLTGYLEEAKSVALLSVLNDVLGDGGAQ